MPNPDPYGHLPPSQGNTQSPSVPLSVYRELAAELQATQAMLDSLHAQNQKLSQENQQLSLQNQQLQSEIAQVVESVLHMRQVANSFNSESEEINLKDPTLSFSLNLEPQRTAPISENNPVRSENFTEQPTRPHFFDLASAETIEKKWWVAIVLAVVVVAFGAGYFLVRPLLQR